MLGNYKIIGGIIIFLLIFGYIFKIKNENTQYIEEIGNYKLTISDQKREINILSNTVISLEEQNNFKLESINILQKQISDIKRNNQNSLDNLEKLYTSALEDVQEECSKNLISIPENNKSQVNTLNEKFLNMRNNIYSGYLKY